MLDMEFIKYIKDFYSFQGLEDMIEDAKNEILEMENNIPKIRSIYPSTLVEEVVKRINLDIDCVKEKIETCEKAIEMKRGDKDKIIQE